MGGGANGLGGTDGNPCRSSAGTSDSSCCRHWVVPRPCPYLVDSPCRISVGRDDGAHRLSEYCPACRCLLHLDSPDGTKRAHRPHRRKLGADARRIADDLRHHGGDDGHRFVGRSALSRARFDSTDLLRHARKQLARPHLAPNPFVVHPARPCRCHRFLHGQRPRALGGMACPLGRLERVFGAGDVDDPLPRLAFVASMG